MKKMSSSLLGQVLVLAWCVSGCAVVPEEGTWSAHGTGNVSYADYSTSPYDKTFEMHVTQGEQRDFDPIPVSITLCRDFLELPGTEDCFGPDAYPYRSNNDFYETISLGSADAYGTYQGVPVTVNGTACIVYGSVNISGELLDSSTFTFQIDYYADIWPVDYNDSYDECQDPSFIVSASISGTAKAP